jgi:hypothetical protein
MGGARVGRICAFCNKIAKKDYLRLWPSMWPQTRTKFHWAHHECYRKWLKESQVLQDVHKLSEITKFGGVRLEAYQLKGR